MMLPSRYAFLSLALLLSGRVSGQSIAARDHHPAVATLGRSFVALDGPWKFRTGDDLRWASPAFDDSSWEGVDLAPPAGAHDPDVGLTGYVPGWSAKGHPGYWGYAWYRMWVSIEARPGDTLALSGSPDVESAYQVYLNGQLLGSAGGFVGATPMAYSIQPRIFLLPAVATASLENGRPALLAIRVWMGPWAVGDPQAGGIHIAPLLGENAAIAAQYQIEWLQTIRGYVVEIVEAVLFVLLAVMSATLMAFERSNRAYLWVSAALCLTALVRLNQAVYFWGQVETVHGFELVTVVLLTPLCLGAWALAWNAWFKTPNAHRLALAAGVLLAVYMSAEFVSRSWFYGMLPRWIGAAAHDEITWARILFAVLIAFIAYRGIRFEGRDGWLALPAVGLISIGLFAPELSALHIPGIWFPFGTGVSRTQFAYAAFDAALFALLWHRLLTFAPRTRRLARAGPAGVTAGA
ncbi:MAG: glycoside hydrolase [Gemmatimonadaceae bacterium]